MDSTCETCIHFEISLEQSYCHRYPPNELGFAVVQTDDWCGEYVAKRSAIARVKAREEGRQ